jgi:hypothetical protein
VTELLTVTMNDCLFVGPELEVKLKEETSDSKLALLQKLEARCSELHFIYKQLSGSTGRTESNPLQMEDANSEDNRQTISKIVELYNSMLNVKESERERDKLIMDNIGLVRNTITQEVNKQICKDLPNRSNCLKRNPKKLASRAYSRGTIISTKKK